MKEKAMRPDLWTTQKRYLEKIAVARRPNTVINSRTATNGFIRYLESEHPEVSSFRELERRHVESWFRHLAQRPLKKSTRRNAMIKMRVFLDTIQEERWQEAPPLPLFERGDLPPEDQQLPRPLSPEVDRALQQELRRRDGLIPKALLFMRQTGLRLQELLDLTTDSLHEFSRGRWSLHVPLGKLHNERVIPVDAETAQLFVEMLKLRGSSTGETLAGFLLTHPDGRRYSREALRHALAAAERRAGLSEHPTPHRLRHSYATELLRAGIRLPVLMKLLGHRTIAMTLRYAALTGMDVQRAYAEAMDVVKELYDLASVRPKRGRAETASAIHRSIRERLEEVATDLERLRRDHVRTARKKKVQRLRERLRRLTDDLDAAMS
jgi:site-specific recombinase XerD